MTTLDPRALEEAARVKCRQDEEQMLLPDWDDLDGDQQGAVRGEVSDIITAYFATLPHLTAEDLRDTPAGRALVAEGKSLGWDDAVGELRKGQGLHRALAGTLSTRKPGYEEASKAIKARL